MSGMRTPCLLFLITVLSPALGAESLPDSAPADQPEKDDMQERFSAPAMAVEEMQNLYLRSPTELGNSDEEGMRSVQDKNKYSETDLLFRERRQGDLSAQPPTSFERAPTFAPTGGPAQQL